MTKRTIKDCIIVVLKNSAKPMTATEIYQAIAAQGLYQFNTANPSSVVNSQLRRHCKNLNRKDSVDGCLEFTSDGKFRVAEQR